MEKKQKLRNNEYYNMQPIFDQLYKDSADNKSFNKLLEIISSESNILLAFRNIKKNSGSKTSGTDKYNIDDIKDIQTDEYVKYIQSKLENYQPKSVRRVDIPKEGSPGKTRPLGIPCIEDRIIQQCILQVLDPVCEAKFYNHSYGFRPNRSTTHAIARAMTLMNINKLHYVVDIDIKGFFYNVNHSKLKKQLWKLGIQDKNLISILSKILKSEIEGEGIPNKGTPQGGIISPLLSNVVLNELDWWISSQWETFETEHSYTHQNKYRAMRKTKLKEIFIVRYADDFKIFCRDYKTAQKVFVATKKWLKERLQLDISPEKSKVTNLRKNYTDFLGIKMKVVDKGKKKVCKSCMTEKSIKKVTNRLNEQIKTIQKNMVPDEVYRLNSIILGEHNYYKMASEISIDMGRINFLVTKTLDNRLRRHITNKCVETDTYKKFYGKYNGKVRTVSGVTIFPIYGCKNNPPLNFSQETCDYNEYGRQLHHNNLEGCYTILIEHLLKNPSREGTVEYNDNRMSLMAGQRGKCYITGQILSTWSMECHHKTPKSKGGTDEYSNLVWVSSEAHKLIHATKTEMINKYMEILDIDEKGLERINSMRKQVGNSEI